MSGAWLTSRSARPADFVDQYMIGRGRCQPLPCPDAEFFVDRETPSGLGARGTLPSLQTKWQIACCGRAVPDDCPMDTVTPTR